MRKLMIILLCVSAVACSSTKYTVEAYQRKGDDFVGQSEVVLVSSLGAPDNVYTTEDGVKVLTYVRERTATYSLPSTKIVNGTAYGGGQSTSYYGTEHSTKTHTSQYRCKTNFVVERGTVVSWNFKGNDCKAPHAESL